MTNRPSLRRSTVLLAAATALIAVVALAGCSGNSDSDDGAAADGGGADDSAFMEGGESGGAQPDSPAARDTFTAGDTVNAAAPEAEDGSSRPIDVPDDPAALIKTAAIELESDDVGAVITDLKGFVLTAGGRVDSENTATDKDGKEVSTRMEVKVPVATFETAVDRISRMAPRANVQTSTEDVTARVADVNSRVASAKDSIRQLRTLFGQATQLGQIIVLERELSRRQADLESLQAQQRSLQSRTSMSTLLVSVTEPELVEAKTEKKDTDQAGFISGIKKGWDGMVTFVVGTSHAVGLVLPLGALALLVAGLAWPFVRRFMSRGDPQPQPSE